jgi:hypothetical protein
MSIYLLEIGQRIFDQFESYKLYFYCTNGESFTQGGLHVGIKDLINGPYYLVPIIVGCWSLSTMACEKDKKGGGAVQCLLLQ